MTEQEVAVVLSFLTSGLLAGIVAGWLDQLVAYIKRK
jgi:hypothetical protein